MAGTYRAVTSDDDPGTFTVLPIDASTYPVLGPDCEASVSGEHDFEPDYDRDDTGQTLVCIHCGEIL